MFSDFHNASQKNRRAFTLVEVLIAGVVLLIGLTASFTVASKMMDFVRSAKHQAAASHTLQERLEQLRAANWSQITGTGWLQSNAFLGVETSSAAIFPIITESVTLTEYPPPATLPGKFLTAVRTNGVVTTGGTSDMKTTKAVQVNLSITWSATSKIQRTYSTTAIIASGGITR